MKDDSVDDWSGVHEQWAKYREWNSKAMKNGVWKYRLKDRTKFINGGTILVDDKYYFYSQKKIVRIKGTNEKHKVKSFKHFYDEFLR